jgi:phosphoribosyl 1,2-cyclic phosphate phosphodiesterase
MRYFTFLGTGTSQGIPVIGCTCNVCTSSDPRDKRLRTSAMVSMDKKNIVIDTGPDFRQQILRAGVDDMEAILFTHGHNDHTAGLDDVRPINFLHKKRMPLYATPSVQKELKTRFAYAFGDEPYPGAPQLEFVSISKDKIIEIGDFRIQPIEVSHGVGNTVLGFRFNDLVYITDCKSIENEEFEKLKGCKILILNALHHSPHHSHLNLEEALAIIEKIQPEKAYLTHLSHNMGRMKDVIKTLPKGVSLAYDRLRIEF